MRLLLVATVAAVGACSSSTTSTPGPTPVKCQVALTASPSIDASGGTGTVTVTTQPECAWSASTQVSWISELAPTSGQGTGQVTFRAASNPLSVAREGDIAVNDERVRVSQQASPCRYEIRPASRDAGATGGSDQFAVTAQEGCTWTAASNQAWISIASGATGSGNGSVSYAVQANTGAPRSGTITVAGLTFTVNQESGLPNCTYTLSSSSVSVSAAAGSGSVNVTAGGGCTWMATSNAAWITVTAGASGNGNGSVSFSVQANTGAARSGTISVAGQTFTVNQADGTPSCSYLLSSTAVSVPAATSSGSVNVTAGTGCAWTAVSNAAWITVTAGTPGSGNGTVSFNVAANTGAARSGTITIAGQTFTVNQADGTPSCTYQLSSTNVSVPAATSSGSVNVTAGTGCAWTAVSNAAWITVTAGTPGSGNGSVSFNVDANTGAARSGTINIAGQTFTVNQAGVTPSCTYQLSATSTPTPVSAAGGPGTVNVTAGSGCTWTAVSNDGWITVTGGASGSGNGPVSFNVAANTGAARSGTITIAGQTFTVNQADGTPSCTYQLSSTNVSVPAATSSGSVNVTAGTGCAWTAVSNAAWITVTAGTPGSGNGSVSFNVAANTDAARSGTITIAGQTFTVNQADGCTYTIAPTSVSIAAAGTTSPESFMVSAGTGCGWKARSKADWITIISGESGTGNGSVAFTVQANTGAARSDTIFVEGQTFTVNQAGP